MPKNTEPLIPAFQQETTNAIAIGSNSTPAFILHEDLTDVTANALDPRAIVDANNSGDTNSDFHVINRAGNGLWLEIWAEAIWTPGGDPPFTALTIGTAPEVRVFGETYPSPPRQAQKVPYMPGDLGTDPDADNDRTRWRPLPDRDNLSTILHSLGTTVAVQELYGDTGKITTPSKYLWVKGTQRIVATVATAAVVSSADHVLLMGRFVS